MAKNTLFVTMLGGKGKVKAPLKAKLLPSQPSFVEGGHGGAVALTAEMIAAYKAMEAGKVAEKKTSAAVVPIAKVFKWNDEVKHYVVSRLVLDGKTLGGWVCTCKSGGKREGFDSCTHVWCAKLAIYGQHGSPRKVQLTVQKPGTNVIAYIKANEPAPAAPASTKSAAQITSENETELAKLKNPTVAEQAAAVVGAVQKMFGANVVIGGVELATGKSAPVPAKVSASHVLANGACTVCKSTGAALEKPCGNKAFGTIGFIELD